MASLFDISTYIHHHKITINNDSFAQYDYSSYMLYYNRVLYHSLSISGLEDKDDDDDDDLSLTMNDDTPLHRDPALAIRPSILVRHIEPKAMSFQNRQGRNAPPIGHPPMGNPPMGHPPMGNPPRGNPAMRNGAYQTGPPPQQPPIQSNSQPNNGFVNNSYGNQMSRGPPPRGPPPSVPSSNGLLPSGPPPNAFPARGVPPRGNISNVNSSFNQRPPNAGYNLPPNAMPAYSAPPRQENNFAAPQTGQIHNQAPQMHNPPPPPQGRNGYTMGRPPPNGPVPNVNVKYNAAHPMPPGMNPVNHPPPSMSGAQSSGHYDRTQPMQHHHPATANAQLNSHSNSSVNNNDNRMAPGMPPNRTPRKPMPTPSGTRQYPASNPVSTTKSNNNSRNTPRRNSRDNRIDPKQIPRPLFNSSVSKYKTNSSKSLIPTALSPYEVIDLGGSSPRFCRMSMKNIPRQKELWKTCGKYTFSLAPLRS